MPDELQPGDSARLTEARITAFHEIGHAVASVLYEVPFHGVEVRYRRRNGRWSWGGLMHDRIEDERIVSLGRDEVMRYLVMLFSGAAAERLVHHDECAIAAGCRDDEDEARHLAELACPSPERLGQCDALIREARAAASKLVADHADKIRLVVDALLLRDGGLHAREVENLVLGRRRDRLSRPG